MKRGDTVYRKGEPYTLVLRLRSLALVAHTVPPTDAEKRRGQREGTRYEVFPTRELKKQ